MAQFDLFLSGTFHLTVDGRPAPPFRTDKARALLAYLAMESDRPHQRQTLATLFWPEMATEAALRNLRKALHLLRKGLTLAAPSLDESLLITSRQTIQLDITDLHVDMLHLQNHVRSWERHAHIGEHAYLCNQCMAHLHAAVDLYRGDFLAGFSLPDSLAFDAWSLTWQSHLHTLTQRSLRRLAVTHVARSELSQARTYAIRHIELDPFNEEAVQDLMRILAQSGQRGKSLETYSQLKTLLNTEMGLLPDDLTTALRNEILTGTEWQTAAMPSPDPPNQLPVAPLAREGVEIAQVQARLLDSSCRLLTILGPGGVGKSWLARQAVANMQLQRAFPGGIVYVSLVGICTDQALRAKIEQAIKSDGDAGGPVESKMGIAGLDQRRTLLFLDDIKDPGHLAPTIADLLAATQNLCIVATACAPFHLQDEYQFRKSCLAYPDPSDQATQTASIQALRNFSAIDLFVQSAQQVRPDFTLTAENKIPVARICAAVQGLPLGIQIAASWTRILSCAAIAGRLDKPEIALDFLVSPLTDLHERHHSLVALFDHAWDRLSDSEQQVLVQLTRLQSPFDQQAIHSLTIPEMNCLASLQDQSLIQRTADRSFFISDLLRQYILHKSNLDFAI